MTGSGFCIAFAAGTGTAVISRLTFFFSNFLLLFPGPMTSDFHLSPSPVFGLALNCAEFLSAFGIAELL